MKTFLFLVVSIAAILVDGLALSKLWLWFIHPLGVPAISFAHAIGISVIVSVLTYRAELQTNEDTTLTERIITNTLFTLLMFIFGWIAHLCM